MALLFDFGGTPCDVAERRRRRSAGVACKLILIVVTIIVSYLTIGCQFGLGGAVKEMGPNSDSALAKLTGLDGRGAEEVTGAVGAKLEVDAGDESNEATQGDINIEGEGATVYNVQAVGGSALLVMILALGVGLYLARKKGGAAEAVKDKTTEALDRLLYAINNSEYRDQIAKTVHAVGCSRHPTRGEIHDDAEDVIRERLLELKKRPRG